MHAYSRYKSLHLTQNNPNLEKILDPEEKRKLIQLRIKIQAEMGSRAKNPFRNAAASYYTAATWGMRLTTSYKEITAGIKRLFKNTSSACNPEDFIPQSYFTRIKDGVNYPVNPKHF